MPGHTDPLLGSNQDGESETQNDLERGLSSGHGGNDFRHLIETQPEAVIK